MVELNRLWSLGGRSCWQQLSVQMTRLRQQFPLTSRAVVRMFFNLHPPPDCAIVSSAGGSAIAASFNGLTSHSIMALTSVGAAAAAAASALNTVAAGAARGGRHAQLQS